MNMNMNPNEAAAIAKIQAPVIADVTLADDSKAPFAVVPKEMELKSLKFLEDERLESPARRKGTAKVFDMASFIALTNRFKTEGHSALFGHGEIDGHLITAELHSVLNYTPESAEFRATGWKDHKVSYHFPVSDELKTWLENDGKEFDQKAFADFLEDNSPDMAVLEKDDTIHVRFGGMPVPKFAKPSDIFLLGKGIEVRVNEKINQAVRQQNGTVALQYSTEHEGADGTPLVVPDWFLISIRMFEGGDYYLIPVRLRYRVRGGSVVWFYNIFRLKDIFDMAFFQATDNARASTALPFFNGQPE